uniref:Global nitrogen transcriptional regulator n=1 Tax=Helminthocladia australis TaxID=260093 RepID=A0A1G4NTR7_9FLOR|nr:Global nitrogen transcriptional regulator [Helminthocladia australis]SCW22050.1 Global nitrogen transcriptional regulator [Helminthocladia australis]
MAFDTQISTLNITPCMYKLHPGDSLIIHPEDNNIYIIIQGLLIIHQTFSNGTKISKCIIKNGYFINQLFQSRQIHNYFYIVEATNISYVLTISHKDVFNVQKVLILHKNQLLSSRNVLDVLIHKNIKERIVHLILMLSELAGRSSNNYIFIDIHLSLSTIATIVGSSRNTVSSIINEFRKNKLIAYQKQKIIIYDISKLLSHRSI